MKRPTVDLVTEREANYFAICLLVPEQMLHDEFAKLTPAERDIDHCVRILAERFQVSQQVMALRLNELGYGL